MKRLRIILSWTALISLISITLVLVIKFARLSYLDVTTPIMLDYNVYAPILPMPWQLVAGYACFYVEMINYPVYGLILIMSMCCLALLLKGYLSSWWLLKYSEGKYGDTTSKQS